MYPPIYAASADLIMIESNSKKKESASYPVLKKRKQLQKGKLESCQDMSEYMLSTLECLHVGVKKGKLVRLC